MQEHRDGESDGRAVSLLKLKETARRLLPISSAARSVILPERDFLPAAEARAKFKVFDQLLVAELDSKSAQARICRPEPGRGNQSTKRPVLGT